jgi:phosphohistidine phosphatase
MMADSVMIVGHMPYMSRLASLLINGIAAETAFVFGIAAVACLRRDRGAWSLLWLLTPEMITEEGRK